MVSSSKNSGSESTHSASLLKTPAYFFAKNVPALRALSREANRIIRALPHSFEARDTRPDEPFWACGLAAEFISVGVVFKHQLDRSDVGLSSQELTNHTE